jgi:hypothetical protein
MQRNFSRGKLCTTVVFLLLLATFAQGGIEAAVIAVYVDGRPLAFPLTSPQVRGGRVLLPLRAAGEAIGASVDWEEATGEISAFRGANKVTIYPEAAWAWVNGRRVELDIPALIENGITFVPVRFFGESLGVAVAWDANSGAVLISTNGNGKETSAETTAPAVSGSTVFTDKINSALALLAAQAPGHYREVCAYLATISEGEHSGVDVYNRNFVVGNGTAAAADSFWLASVIVHDAHHVRMYSEGKTFAGEAAERECIEVQKRALLEMEAPRQHIEHLDTVTATGYWEVPYDNRNW